MAELFLRLESKSIKEINDLIEDQYWSVGADQQNILKNKAESNGNKFKPEPYMECQRKYCWKKSMAGSLFFNILNLDGIVSEMRVYRIDGKSNRKKVMDGQQRLTSIYMITHDMIPIDVSKVIKSTFLIDDEQHDTNELQGKLFSELPKYWQDIFWGRHLRYVCVDNCDEKTAEEMYMEINSCTKPLRPVEIRKAAMGGAIRKIINETRQSEWLLHAMTPLAVCSNHGEEVISHTITLLDNNMQPCSLTSENVSKTIYKYRDSGLPENIVTSLTEINLYLNDVTRIWTEEKRMQDEKDGIKKGSVAYTTVRFSNIFDKTNTVMIMFAANIAIKHNIDIKDFANWSYKFFNKDFPNEEYENACGKDTNKRKACDKDAVEDRMRLIMASMASLHSKNVLKEQEEQTVVEHHVTEEEMQRIIQEETSDLEDVHILDDEDEKFLDYPDTESGNFDYGEFEEAV